MCDAFKNQFKYVMENKTMLSFEMKAKNLLCLSHPARFAFLFVFANGSSQNNTDKNNNKKRNYRQQIQIKDKRVRSKNKIKKKEFVAFKIFYNTWDIQ